MTMRESLELQQKFVQNRREAAALQALEQMLIEDPCVLPPLILSCLQQLMSYGADSQRRRGVHRQAERRGCTRL